MGVASISGADRGDHAEYVWNWSNQSSIMRYGALVAHKIGGNAREVLVAGESASAGEIIGPCLQGSTEPSLSTYLPVDGTGATGIAVAQAPARAHYIVAPNNAVAEGDLLIPTGTTGQVKPRPAGSNVQPVAKALQAVSSSASEQYVQGEALTPATGKVRQWIMAAGVNAATADYYLGDRSSNHVNPAAAKNTPVIFQAIQDCTLKHFRASLEIAAGGAKVVNYLIKKGADAAAANAAAASLTLTVTDPAKTASDDTTEISLTAGQCVVIKLTSADVGAAEHSRVQFGVL